VLHWLVQQDQVIALSRTTNPRRALENLAVFDIELSPLEMSQITALARPNSRIVSPSWALAEVGLRISEDCERVAQVTG
jgi:2,5-diketo-D-gluconate reductase B